MSGSLNSHHIPVQRQRLWDQIGPVAILCHSFDPILCSKGDERWVQVGRMNFTKMQCGSR